MPLSRTSRNASALRHRAGTQKAKHEIAEVWAKAQQRVIAALRPGHETEHKGIDQIPTVHGVVFAVWFQPRPTNGIFVAITVMVSTLASSGRLAM